MNTKAVPFKGDNIENENMTNLRVSNGQNEKSSPVLADSTLLSSFKRVGT